MTPPYTRQTENSHTPVTSAPKPSDKPHSDKARHLMEQASDAIENNREGFGSTPIDVPPASAETFEESSQGGTEPTHRPITEADRRR